MLLRRMSHGAGVLAAVPLLDNPEREFVERLPDVGFLREHAPHVGDVGDGQCQHLLDEPQALGLSVHLYWEGLVPARPLSGGGRGAAGSLGGQRHPGRVGEA